MTGRCIYVALAMLLLVACGGTSTANSAGAPGGASAAVLAVTRPEDTVAKALDAMMQKDEATLTDMFDASVGDLRSTLAFQAIRDWTKIGSTAQVPGAVGPA